MAAILEAIVSAVVGSDIPDAPSLIRLTDAKDFKFKDLELAGNLVSWNDRIGVRLALHQYLKRDGAEVEPMGAEPGRFTMRLAFLGKAWAKQYRALVASIRDDPRGQMTHPILGSMQVACESISDAQVVPGQERDSISVTVTFVEDAIDALSLSERFPGPIARQARVESKAARLVDAVAGFATSASLAVTAAASAITFAAAANQVLSGGPSAGPSGGVPDPTIRQRLRDIGEQTAKLIAAVRSDVARNSQRRQAEPRKAGKQATDAAAFPAIEAAQSLYAECLALMESVTASQPAQVEYIVPARAHVATIAAALYGKDALLRIDEMLRANRLPDPHAIRAGTRLQLPTPTI